MGGVQTWRMASLQPFCCHHAQNRCVFDVCILTFCILPLVVIHARSMDPFALMCLVMLRRHAVVMAAFQSMHSLAMVPSA